jgi:hypothetical protein
MRTTIVPAQITSVEDKIAGNLSFTQLLLMIVPVFVSAGLFVFLPPFTTYKLYKVFITVSIALICLALALRIKGRLVVQWIIILSRYNARPRFYVFNKNSSYARTVVRQKRAIPTIETELVPEVSLEPSFAFNTGEVMDFEKKISNPAADFHFKRNKKGGLSVGIKR